MDLTYEGWSNRETWAYKLWIDNEQDLYEEVKNQVNKIMKNTNLATKNLDSEIHELTEYLKNLCDEIKELAKESKSNVTLQNIVDDLGSTWRIDYREIAETLINEYMENLKRK